MPLNIPTSSAGVAVMKWRVTLRVANVRGCVLLEGNRDALGTNDGSATSRGWVERCEHRSRTVRMINTAELAVKGGDLPSKLTPDPFDRHGRDSVCTQTALSMGSGEQLDLNSGTDRAILNIY